MESKSRDESKATFIWKERRGTMGKAGYIENKTKRRYIHKDKFLRKSRSDLGERRISRQRLRVLRNNKG